MEGFLKEWYGILLFVLFDLAAVTVLICITYRWFFKRIFDFFCAAVALVATSPAIFIAYLVASSAKKRGETESVIVREIYLGKKGKKITLHAFACGRAGKLLRLYDLLLGRLSVIGTKPLTAGECAFLDEDEEERMLIRSGLIHPLVLSGNAQTDYDEMIAVEREYARKFSFFGDMKIFFTWLLKNIRGEGNGYLGETRAEGYLEALLKEERITQADYDAARE